MKTALLSGGWREQRINQVSEILLFRRGSAVSLMLESRTKWDHLNEENIYLSKHWQDYLKIFYITNRFSLFLMCFKCHNRGQNWLLQRLSHVSCAYWLILLLTREHKRIYEPIVSLSGVCFKLVNQLVVFADVISKFRSSKKQISISKCLWDCKRFKTTLLGQILKPKSVLFKGYRQMSIRHFW